jgi:7,8-dihydropterin-6-yl-methyl-4-(beta-D-ribofuranosyl)aminobenzene 5'-phosphate synthase
MKTGMNRREFLKTTVASGAVLLSGNILNGVSNAQGRISVPEAEKIVITILTDNYSDINVYKHKIAQRFRRDPNLPTEKWALHAEHGLSYFIETTVNGVEHSLLFDFGSDVGGVVRNMEILKINLSKLEAMALSHGHWDHQTPFIELMKAKRAVIQQGTPLYVGEEAFIERFSSEANGKVISMGQLKREDIEGLGFVKIVEIKDPTSVVPGAFCSGKIDMLTEYEKIPPRLVKKQGNEFVQDLFTGEQAIILNLKGKGLIVLSGCAHRGIVNTCKQAQKITGIEKIEAVVGGFHLVEAKPDKVQQTISAMKTLSPNYIVPTHCTGFGPITAFAREMPDQFVLSSVGTRFTFGG